MNRTCSGGCKTNNECTTAADKTTYTLSVNGVTATDINPLVGATISLSGMTYWNYSISQTCTMTTGIYSDKGACMFVDVPKGKYNIYANATG